MERIAVRWGCALAFLYGLYVNGVLADNNTCLSATTISVDTLCNVTLNYPAFVMTAPHEDLVYQYMAHQYVNVSKLNYTSGNPCLVDAYHTARTLALQNDTVHVSFSGHSFIIFKHNCTFLSNTSVCIRGVEHQVGYSGNITLYKSTGIVCKHNHTRYTDFFISIANSTYVPGIKGYLVICGFYMPMVSLFALGLSGTLAVYTELRLLLNGVLTSSRS
ncbi:glycoprotein 3 [Wobbly possum disease virus]|uniref:Glycoprotein 3 n=1 Tax=Wobbly possum disease virus TaxID=1118369 RepID=G9FGS0_9NIDO|nr:glycoprotein 3 [Wobbly possum disease virus]AEU12350.1 glycoprotein 3 [Wobbly possum disease virus]